MSNIHLEAQLKEAQQQLKACHARVEAILHNSLDAIVLLGFDFSIQQVNTAFNRLFACEPNDYIDRTLFDLIDPVNVDQVSAAIQRVINEHQGTHIEIQARRKDGSTFDIELSIGDFKGTKDQGIEGFVCTLRDITEHKEQQRQLRYHASLQQNVSDAVIVTDMKFRIQSWNKAAERIYGWSVGDVIGQSVANILKTEFLSDGERERSIQQLQEQGWWQGEVTQHHSDGSIRHILGSVTLIKDESGQPFSVVSVNHDITERKQAEESLQKSSAEIRHLYNNAPCGYHSIDRHGVIVQINDTELRWLGYNREDVVGKLKITDLFPLPSRQIFQKQFPLFIERGHVNGLELEVIRKDGSIIPIILNGTAVYDEDAQFLYSNSTIFDISDLKRTQAALEVSEQRFKLLFNSIRDYAILMMDVEGKIISWNPGAEAIKGYTEEEVIGRPLSIFYTPEDNAKNEPQRILKIAEDNGHFVGEGWRVRKDGSLFWASVVLSSIHDSSGALVGFTKITRDLTMRKQADDTLSESEARYRLVAENVTDLILKTDAEGIRTFVTPSCYALLGYRPEELLGKSRFEIMHPDDRPLSEAMAKKAISSGETHFSISQRVQHKDGYYVWIEATNRIIRDKNSGHVIEIVAVMRDITKRKKAEVELRESEHRYHALFEQSHDAVFLIDMQGNSLEVNHRAAEMLGYSVEELRTLSFRELSDEVSKSEATIQNLLSGETIPMYERIMRKKDGSRISAEINVEIVRDLDGNPLHIQTVVRDITERNRAKESLRESEGRYRLLAENISDVIMRSNTAGEYLYVSPSIQTVLGYEVQEFLGKRGVNNYIHPDDASIVQQALISAREQNLASVTQVVRFRHKQGHYVWLETIGRSIRSEKTGEIEGFISSSRDISKRKQAEEALRQSEERFALIFRLSPVAIGLTIAADGRYLDVNDSLLKLLGYSRDEMIGRTAGELNVWVAPEERETAVRSIRENGSVRGLEVGFRKKTGEICTTLTSIVPVLLNGQACLLSIVHDITERKATEEALYESQEKFRLLMDAAPVAIVISDQDGHITLVNNQTEAVFGYNRAELIGQSVDILLPNSVRNQHAKNRASYLAAPRVRQMGSGLELSARRKDGSEFPVEIELSYIETPAGLLVMSFVMDITERKHVAAELERQSSFLRSVIDVSPNMIFVKDYDSRFVLVNRRVAQIYNTTIEDLIGKSDADFVSSAQEINGYLEADRRVITSGEPLFIEESATDFLGETHWFQTTKVPIISADGKSKHVLGVSTDITERKHNEAALRESEAKYRSLIETMRGGLAMFDLDNRITYINDRFCEFLGYSRDEIIGTRPSDYVDKTNLPLLASQLQRRRNSESATYELLFRHKNGNPVYLLVSGSPLLNKNGDISGSFAVTTDITLQKQAEDALRQALAKEKELGDLKSRFVSMASHEFRTPLATILALNETLSAYRHKLPEDQIAERFEKIKDQVNHLKDIMDDILLLARMQARRVEFNPVILDLDNLCRSVLDEFQGRPDVTHLIEYSCDTVLQRVRLDKKLMRQVLNNLITNAIKYSSPNKTIRVSLSYISNALALRISDQGIGIPEADLEHLFEPFHRAANVGAVSGTGLGLVIVKEAVELHGGTISVESQIDVGTTFTIRIPILIEEDHNDDKSSGH